MKKIFTLHIAFSFSMALFSQKPPIDLDAIDNWPAIANEQISSDGKIVTYIIQLRNAEDTLVIQSTDNSWMKKIPAPAWVKITADSRFVIYQKKDSLFVFDVNAQNIKSTFENVLTFEIPLSGTGRWIAIAKTKPERRLVLYDLQNGAEKIFDQTGFYEFSKNGDVLVVQSRPENDTEQSLQWIDLKTSQSKILMHPCNNIPIGVFDESGEQFAFITNDNRSSQSPTVLRYFKKGMDSAVNKAETGLNAVMTERAAQNPTGQTGAALNAVRPLQSGQTDNIPSKNLSIAPIRLRFSPNGKRIFFSLKKTEPISKPSPDAADVHVWNYADDYLQTEQLARVNITRNRTFTAVLNLDENKFFQIDEEADEPFIELANEGDGDIAVFKRNNNYFAGRWRESTIPFVYIKNIQTGERKLLLTQRDITTNVSPTGKYVIWFDGSNQGYFSYEASTGKIKNISSKIPVRLSPQEPHGRGVSWQPCGVAGWLSNDAAVLVYDEYDIWKIDPAGFRAPVNLTNGYGRRNHIIFRIWNGSTDYAVTRISESAVLLAAFKMDSRDNGFFTLTITNSTPRNPELKSLNPCLFYAHLRFNLHLLKTSSIIKAADANVYLLHRQTSKDFPNIVVTRDFKNFDQLSQLNPEKNYNWLSTELISWKKTDGKIAHGVLYKPENFDSQKKYPLIFYFYEKLSHRLNQFLDPELSGGSISIPYYVSNGYLVFTPDISYIVGKPGDGVLNSVISAAHHLSKLPFVDSTKLGLQGHSFGGYEVNYLISHSKLFAAAQESSGASDFISHYNGFYREYSAQFYFEYGQGRIGATLWEKPELYFKNSPIFLANKVTTPLLIMHNKDDGEVPFQQGIEWFTALRRSGKKVWMLQYDKEFHGITQRKNQIDFTIRTKQFFDHYLKGLPEPKWMSAQAAPTSPPLIK